MHIIGDKPLDDGNMISLHGRNVPAPPKNSPPPVPGSSPPSMPPMPSTKYGNKQVKNKMSRAKTTASIFS